MQQVIKRSDSKEIQGNILEVLGCFMKRYYMYWLQLGFYQVAVVGKIVQNRKRDSSIQKEKQYTKNT